MPTIDGSPTAPDEESVRTADDVDAAGLDLTIADREALIEARELRTSQREAELDQLERRLSGESVPTEVDDAVATAETESSSLASSFAAIALDLFGAGELAEVMRRIVEVATSVIGNCDLASVTMLEGDQFSTPVYTHTNALRVDEFQYSTQQGPCIEALLSGTVHGTTPGWREQWPDWAAKAEEAGIGSVLAVPLRIPDTIHLRLGAVNMYSYSADGFTDADQELALILSAHAAIAAVVARERDERQHQERSFHEALGSRDVIGQAKGMLMERHQITADEAFDILRRSSQNLNSKLRDVAARLVSGIDSD
ncbi:MAG TPA: GAF and ANTAR domain-containing protein [Acidimicrobiia bacterium]|nr:GAF and ANTAR domain-containing protein [Acidimicrobiia bacterium]